MAKRGTKVAKYERCSWVASKGRKAAELGI